MGRWLAAHDLEPDVILCSSAVRAHATAEHVAAETGADAPTVRGPLYGGDVEDYVAELARLGDDARVALIVGHGPTVSMLVAELVDRDEDMPTAAVAVIELPIDRWADVTGGADGRLVAVWRPREIADGAG
jgi:phosphohistidine phosphatase